MKRLSVTIVFLVLLWSGCKKDDDDEPPQDNQPPGGDVASGTVTSTDSGHIASPEGAYIDVPVGAVPLTLDSSAGTMIFSIERLPGPPEVSNPPDSLQRIGPAYRFGPGGFVFEQPVEVAIPVAGTYQVGELLLARIDPTTREPELVSADYDPAAGVIRAHTQEMSDWDVYQAFNPVLAWARVRVSVNFEPPFGIIGSAVGICAENFTPQFPEDTVNNRAVRLSVLNGRSKVWTIPQGTYQFCVQFMYINPEASAPVFNSYTLPVVEARNLEGWATNTDLINATMTITQEHFDASTPSSFCSCRLRSTPSPGTGQLQVTLTWYRRDALDLDLWVTDPSGERCYYGNTTTASGGELDRDNHCGNYQNGAPENIFWRTAPNGLYKVEVNWYSSCGQDGTQPFAVRVAGEGLTPITESKEISTGQTVTVGEYTLSGGTLQAISTPPAVRYETASRPEKNPAQH